MAELSKRERVDAALAGEIADRVPVSDMTRSQFDGVRRFLHENPQGAHAALTAIRATNGRHLLLTPGCGTNLDVPDANMHVLRRAATVAASAQ